VAPRKQRLEQPGSESQAAPSTNFVLQSEAGDGVGGLVVNNQMCPASRNRRNVSGTGQRWAALPCGVVLSLSPV